jgi:hypothetical protein
MDVLHMCKSAFGIQELVRNSSLVHEGVDPEARGGDITLNHHVSRESDAYKWIR